MLRFTLLQIEYAVALRDHGSVAEAVERGVIALAGLKQIRKTRLVSAFEAHCVDYFGNSGRAA